MSNQLFTNSHILSWLQYFSENTELDLEHLKILDITRKNKNLIPTVESHRAVLVFTEAGHPDIFYKMFNAGLGECDVVYNEGSEPSGKIKRDKVYDMINRGINASAGMLILNPNARTTIKFGMDNDSFVAGSVKYVGSEIRSIILNKMQLGDNRNMCVISGESIAIEAACMSGESTVIAVEYRERDRQTLEDNIHQFGLHNIVIIDHIDANSMKDLPVPEVTMLVASPSMEQEMKCLLDINPQMRFVVYTLDFLAAAELPELCHQLGLGVPEIIHLSVSKLGKKNIFEAQPVPWIITI